MRIPHESGSVLYCLCSESFTFFSPSPQDFSPDILRFKALLLYLSRCWVHRELYYSSSSDAAYKSLLVTLLTALRTKILFFHAHSFGDKKTNRTRRLRAGIQTKQTCIHTYQHKTDSVDL